MIAARAIAASLEDVFIDLITPRARCADGGNAEVTWIHADEKQMAAVLC